MADNAEWKDQTKAELAENGTGCQRVRGLTEEQPITPGLTKQQPVVFPPKRCCSGHRRLGTAQYIALEEGMDTETEWQVAHAVV